MTQRRIPAETREQNAPIENVSKDEVYVDLEPFGGTLKGYYTPDSLSSTFAGFDSIFFTYSGSEINRTITTSTSAVFSRNGSNNEIFAYGNDVGLDLQVSGTDYGDPAGPMARFRVGVTAPGGTTFPFTRRFIATPQDNTYEYQVIIDTYPRETKRFTPGGVLGYDVWALPPNTARSGFPATAETLTFNVTISPGVGGGLYAVASATYLRASLFMSARRLYTV